MRNTTTVLVIVVLGAGLSLSGFTTEPGQPQQQPATGDGCSDSREGCQSGVKETGNAQAK